MPDALAHEVVGAFKETGSGEKLDRTEWKKVMAQAQRREVDAILVTELSRWGRSNLDLQQPHGRMMATIIAGIAKSERELIWSASAQALQPQRRVAIARAPARGQRLKSDRLAPKVLALVAAEQSFRLIGRELGLSKNTGRGNR